MLGSVSWMRGPHKVLFGSETPIGDIVGRDVETVNAFLAKFYWEFEMIGQVAPYPKRSSDLDNTRSALTAKISVIQAVAPL